MSMITPSAQKFQKYQQVLPRPLTDEELVVKQLQHQQQQQHPMNISYAPGFPIVEPTSFTSGTLPTLGGGPLLLSSGGPVAYKHQQQQQRRAPAAEKQPRTPLALLHEICSKTNIQPKITLQEEGPVHDRLYKSRLVLEFNGNCWEADGIGRNIQSSKQNVARNLLLKMDPTLESMLIPLPTEQDGDGGGNGKQLKQVPTIEVDPIPDGNPVGELNDVCNKLKVTAPLYNEEGQLGPSHNRVYIVSCAVGEKIKVLGKGTTKKFAKKACAAAALKEFHELFKAELTTQQTDLNKLASLFQQRFKFEDQPDGLSGKSPAAGTSASTATATATRSFIPLADTVKKLQQCTGPKLEHLITTNIKELQKCDPCEILQDICAEQQWNLEYLDFPPTTATTKEDFRSLLSCQLDSSSGPILLSGVGKSLPQARKKATVELLDLLRFLRLAQSSSQSQHDNQNKV